MTSSRSPHRERGLKLVLREVDGGWDWSLPSPGAWIETTGKSGECSEASGRSPHRERGLKRQRVQTCAHWRGRSPHRERGLKLAARLGLHLPAKSLPSPGAWIETVRIRNPVPRSRGSLPSPGAWIETGTGGGCSWARSRRSPHRERGLKRLVAIEGRARLCRSPHRERGLKQQPGERSWSCRRGRSPHRERGLKQLRRFVGWHGTRRSPHRERGLKRSPRPWRSWSSRSLPSPGAWIETTWSQTSQPDTTQVAPLTGSVD